MVEAAHKTGKLQCYRIQQYSTCSNTISLNFSERAPPPLLLTIINIIMNDDNDITITIIIIIIVIIIILIIIISIAFTSG